MSAPRHDAAKFLDAQTAVRTVLNPAMTLAYKYADAASKRRSTS
jgi:hypothetical protein